MVISNVHTKEVLECWDFRIDPDRNDQNKDPNVDPNNPTSSKELKKIQAEIGAVMRQIAATVSYLPLLECLCSFDLLIHTLKDCDIPDNWNETENVSIKNSQVVNLKSFSTGLHKLDTVVSYKMTD
jgi:mitotic spindle assembly checkpoint protein MAD2